MDSYRPETYGDRIADVYDRLTATLPEPVDCVDRLAEPARPAPAPQLALAPGRTPLPPPPRGFEVHGSGASAAMVERLRAKPGGEAIPVTIGDFADLPVDGSFPLVYVGLHSSPRLPPLPPPPHPGRTGPLLRRGGRPPGPGGRLRARAVRSRPEPPPRRPEHEGPLPRPRPGPVRPRPARPGHPAGRLPERPAGRRRHPAPARLGPLRLAVGAGPDGPPCTGAA